MNTENASNPKYTTVNLDYLRLRTKNNLALMKEMITIYLQQTPPLLAAMKESSKAANWQGVYAAVHKIIPSFSMMGFDKKYEELAIQIQTHAREEIKTDELPNMIIQIDTVCNAGFVELEEELGRLS